MVPLCLIFSSVVSADTGTESVRGSKGRADQDGFLHVLIL